MHFHILLRQLITNAQVLKLRWLCKQSESLRASISTEELLQNQFITGETWLVRKKVFSIRHNGIICSNNVIREPLLSQSLIMFCYFSSPAQQHPVGIIFPVFLFQLSVV